MAMLGSAGAVGIAYFLAARLGLALLAPESDVAVFWPAAGIAAGIAIISGPRTRAALVIGVVGGTIAADLTRDERLLTTLYSGLCDAGEAVLVAWLLERWFGRPFRFSDLRRLAGFLVAGALATAACAMCGAAIMTLLRTAAPYWDVWQVWFLSDWVGIVAVAPLVIGLGEVWRRPPSQRECIEGLTVLVLTATACFFTMTQNTGSWLSFSPGAFVLPLLLWLAARCQLTFGIAGAFFASVAIILGVTFGVGRFGDEAVPLMERIRGAQVATTVVTLFTLVLGVLFAQRKMAEDGLAKERAMLARLHEVGTRLWLKRDLSQALDEILAGAIELLRADMGAIRILDTARGMLKIEAQRGFSQEYLKCFGEVSAEGGSPCCRAVRSIERIIIEDVEADTLFIPFHTMASAGGYRALQSTPIVNREGTLLGTLATHFRSVHKPEMQDLSLLDLYVRQAAEIIERHNAEEALRESEERVRLAQLRQSKLVAELDHRVKNTLATVSAVVDRTQQMSGSMAEFVVALDGRIKSMAMAQELLSRRRWQGIPLAELVRRELAPYATASNTRIDGPDVVLNAEAGQILAMVFHELATNAAKFGAISVKSGRVFVRWSFSRNGHVKTCLCIYWEESGGPRVEPPSRSGFGTSVVRELVPYELGGTVDLAHLPKGVRCALQIPTHWLM